MTNDAQAPEQLLRHRRVWQARPLLRRVYTEEFFARLLEFSVPGGISIEVGAGPGFFKAFAQDKASLISTDLIACSWLDAAANAQQLPFRSASVSNVFGLDMLHHLSSPMLFLGEAQRVLVPGGRLILIEPWITPFSYFLFRFFHQEDCDFSRKPWLVMHTSGRGEKLAFEGNQAIPYQLFRRGRRERTLEMLPGLALRTAQPFCLFTYLLSGGFNHAKLLPDFLYSAVAGFERATLPVWRYFAALRVLLVLQRKE